jgi:hypothetical protein
MVKVSRPFLMILLPVFEGDGLHRFGWEKLSEKINAPNPGMVSGVGVAAWVGSGVSVAVAGNQLMVAVEVGVGNSMVGVEVAVGANPEQAAVKRLTARKRKTLISFLAEII